jgi:hypothetical protein
MHEITRNLVHVRLSGWTGLVARLVDIAGDTIVIGTPTSETAPVMPELASPIDLGLVTNDGIVWYAGVVTGLEPGLPLRLRVRLVAGTVGIERRASPRVPDALEVEVVDPRSGEPVGGHLVDVSMGGLRVEAPIEVETGDALRLTVLVPEEDPIQLTARVIHVLPNHTKSGLQFELAAAADRERLVRNAFQRLAAWSD